MAAKFPMSFLMLKFVVAGPVNAGKNDVHSVALRDAGDHER